MKNLKYNILYPIWFAFVMFLTILIVVVDLSIYFISLGFINAKPVADWFFQKLLKFHENRFIALTKVSETPLTKVNKEEGPKE